MRGRLSFCVLCVLIGAPLIGAPLIKAPLSGWAQRTDDPPELPPIGTPPDGSAAYFESLRVEFTPAPDTALDIAKTPVSMMVHAKPSPGSFRIHVMLIRNDGQLAPSGTGGIGPYGGSFGDTPHLLPRDIFFRKGDTLNALLLAQFSYEPRAFIVRTPTTPRCVFVNCQAAFRTEAAWQHVHYRRFIPLRWRVE